MIVKPRTIIVLRWIARLLAAVLFVFWGAFFVEHVREWFIRPLPQSPPPSVWVGQFLHALILVGLLAGFKWERVGGLMIIIASTLFLADKAPWFIPITILPGLLYLYCSYKEGTIATQHSSVGV